MYIFRLFAFDFFKMSIEHLEKGKARKSVLGWVPFILTIFLLQNTEIIN